MQEDHQRVRAVVGGDVDAPLQLAADPADVGQRNGLRAEVVVGDGVGAVAHRRRVGGRVAVAAGVVRRRVAVLAALGQGAALGRELVGGGGQRGGAGGGARTAGGPLPGDRRRLGDGRIGGGRGQRAAVGGLRGGAQVEPVRDEFGHVVAYRQRAAEPQRDGVAGGPARHRPAVAGRHLGGGRLRARRRGGRRSRGAEHRRHQGAGRGQRDHGSGYARTCAYACSRAHGRTIPSSASGSSSG